MKREIRNILSVAIGIKLLYVVFALLVSHFIVELYVAFNLDSIIFAFKRNDSWWYEKIVNGWYPKVSDIRELGECSDNPEFSQSPWAFFPFYPALLRGVKTVLGITFEQSAFIVSIIFSLAGFLGFYKLSNLHFKNSSQATTGTILLILVPFHLFFSTFYTEALFLAFVTWAFVFIKTKRYVFLPLVLIPLALLRPNGIVVTLPLFLYYLEETNILQKFSIELKEVSWKKVLNALYLTAIPMAFGFYCWYQYEMTGFWKAFAIAQNGWCRFFGFPLFSLFRETDLGAIVNSIYVVLAMLFSILIWKKIPISFSVFVWLNILLPLSTSVTSMPRYISVIFPIWIMAGHYLHQSKWKKIILWSLVPFHLAFFFLWVKGSYFTI